MVSYEENLDFISQPEGEHTVGIHCYVKLTQSSVRTFWVMLIELKKY